jgi:hypothetical protein
LRFWAALCAASAAPWSLPFLPPFFFAMLCLSLSTNASWTTVEGCDGFALRAFARFGFRVPRAFARFAFLPATNPKAYGSAWCRRNVAGS